MTGVDVTGPDVATSNPPLPSVHFQFEGRELAARPGATVASALIENGEWLWRVTRSRGQPRGLFCGIGTCFDCLVDVAEDKAVRACVRALQEGDEVFTSMSVGTGAAPPPGRPGSPGGLVPGPRPAPGHAQVEVDVGVVGAGPAGMAAALAAARAGARVTLVDAGLRLGGQYLRQPLGPAGPVPPSSPGLPARFRPLEDEPRVSLLLGYEVPWASRDDAGFALSLAGGGGPALARCRSLVLATGASELVLPFPGWELPGVVTAGAAQALLKSQRLAIGQRVLVAGTGPFLLPVAAGLAESGAHVVLVEAAPARTGVAALPSLVAHPTKLTEAARYAGVLARHKVRVLAGRAVVRCEGDGRVERVVVARLGAGWRPVDRRPVDREVLEADAVCVSYGFVPRLELARQLGAAEVPPATHPAVAVQAAANMATSVPGLFVAGELAGVGGAQVAELEGQLAGQAAAAYLGLKDRGSHLRPLSLRLRLAASRAFAAQLGRLYPLGREWTSWLLPQTVFCRCEEVDWEGVVAAIREGAGSCREVRNLTRCGMGYCQGRTCGPALQLALSAMTERDLGQVGDFHKRPVATPVPLGDVARW